MTFELVDTPLFPGQPFGQHGWTELGYDAYSYVVPTELAAAADATAEDTA